MHLIKQFSKELSKYLSSSDSDCIKLIKFFDSAGEFDFNFPLCLKIWRNYLKKETDDLSEKFDDNILKFAAGDSKIEIKQAIEKLKEVSSTWTFVIINVEIKEFRCYIRISRPEAFNKFLNKVTSTYGRRKKLEDETLCIETEIDKTPPTITQYRVDLVTKVIENLIVYSKFVVVKDPAVAKHKILVTSKSNLNKNDARNDRKFLNCGVVIDPVDKKSSQQDAGDYIEKRSEDMHLISIHKYGVRVKNDEAFKELVDKLGRNAVTLDLLEVKQSSAVTLNPDSKQAFIMYNSARLETLMEKFDLKVTEGYYTKLPNIHEIDMSLLKEDDEWILLKLLLSFPEVIDQAIDDLPNGKVSLHLIHKFISALVNTFSVYYRRARLLTENRPQLIPTLHAKIHFLRVFQRILNESLGIFCIEPVAFM